MSPHIKMVVYLSLALLAVFGWHFATVFGVLGDAPETRSEFFIRIGIIFIIFFISSIITSVLMAKKDENAPPPDEREEKIELIVERVGLVTMYIGLLVVMWFAFIPMTAMQIANAILAVICITELIKICYGLFILKRGF